MARLVVRTSRGRTVGIGVSVPAKVHLVGRRAAEMHGTVRIEADSLGILGRVVKLHFKLDARAGRKPLRLRVVVILLPVEIVFRRFDEYFRGAIRLKRRVAAPFPAQMHVREEI